MPPLSVCSRTARREVSPRNLAASQGLALSRSGSPGSRRELVDERGARLADDLSSRGIRSSRTTDCADDHSLIDQWNAASRRNNSIEREQIVEVHELDPVLEDFCWAPKCRGCSCLVLGDLNGGKHRAIHSLEGN